jgi:sulfur relay protein TusB/DsrH
MGIVYLIGKSPYRLDSFEAYLQISKLQVQEHQATTLIFLQDGVIVAQQGNTLESRLVDLKQAGVNIYFRKEDLLARGIQQDQLTSAGKSVSMKQIMDILAGATSVVSAL